MKTIVEKDGYFCSLIEATDFEIFKKAMTACTAEKEPPDVNLTDIIEKTNGECLRVFFEDPDIDHFVLLKKNDEDDLCIIGEVRICYVQENAELEDFHILEEYRGQGLADLLYKATLEHLQQKETKIDSATLHIYDWNTPSIKAAIRNGFNIAADEPVNSNFIPFRRSLKNPEQSETVNRHNL